MGVVLIIARWLRGEDASGLNEVDASDVKIFLSATIMVAIIIMILIMSGCRPTVAWRQDALSHQSHCTLDLLGLYIFGVCTLFLEIFELFAAVECLTMYSDLHNGREYVYFFIFYFLRMCFLMVQMLFLGKFSRATFDNNVLLRYCLFACLSVNLMTWFYTLTDESSYTWAVVEYGTGDGTWWNVYNMNETDPDLLENIRKCAYHNTTWQEKLRNAEPILYPFCMEYSLVAASMLCNIWASMRCSGVDDAASDGHDRACETNSNQVEHSAADDSLDDDDDTAKLSIDNHPEQTRPFFKTDKQQDAERARTSTQQHLTSPCFGVGFLVGASMMAFLLAVTVLLQQNIMYSKTIYIYYGFTHFYYVIMTILCWFGFQLLTKQKYEHRYYCGEDVLLLVSAAGEFAYMYFKMLAAFGMIVYPTCEESSGWYTCVDSGLPWMLLCEKILTGMQLWVQTTFLISAARYKPHEINSSKKLRDVVTCLSFCNLGFWVKSSFVDMLEFPVESIEKQFYNLDDQWDFIMRVMLPFCIFYRFHSTVMLCGISARFKQDGVLDEDKRRERARLVVNSEPTDYKSIEQTKCV
ncbi:uncharacterized protein LOC144356180 [Saccoglossus kowalevskii]